MQTQKGTRTWLQDVMKPFHFCFYFFTKMVPWSHLMETSPLEEGGLGAWGGLQCEKEIKSYQNKSSHGNPYTYKIFKEASTLFIKL